MQIKYIQSRKIWKIQKKHNAGNKMGLRSWHLDNLTGNGWMSIPALSSLSLPCFVLILHFILWIFNFQEGNWAFSAPAEAWLLCEAGHEGHPHGPAHDLHPPPHVHRDFHEEVTVRVPSWVGPTPGLPPASAHLLTDPFLVSASSLLKQLCACIGS